MSNPQLSNPIYPCIWFNGQARQAADFYSAVFPDTRITAENPMVVTIEVGKEKVMFLNGGPIFEPNPSISFFVICENEEETDRTWQALSEGGSVMMPLDTYPWSKKYGWLNDKFGLSWQLAMGELEQVGQKFTSKSQCGWLKDRFGVSWQVVPGILPKLMGDPQKAGKVIEAFMKMRKFYIAELERAAG